MDAQRERAVQMLKRAYAEGRLELEDFTARTERALQARSSMELGFQLRGLALDEARRRARRAAHVAATVAVWALVSLFLAIGCIVALVQTRASLWTLLFPAAWVAVTVAARRELRRDR